MTLRAYQLTDRTDEEAGAMIVFASTAKLARHWGFDGAGYWNTAAKRVPEFDVHYPGPVPIEVLLQHGWYWQCGGCHEVLTQETATVVEEAHREAYCGEACAAKDHGWRRGNAFKRAELTEAELEAKDKWPSATIFDVDYTRAAVRGTPPPDGYRVEVRVYWKLDGGGSLHASWIHGDADLRHVRVFKDQVA